MKKTIITYALLGALVGYSFLGTKPITQQEFLVSSTTDGKYPQMMLAGYWTWNDFGASVFGGGAGGAVVGGVAATFGSPVGVGAGALTGGALGALGGGIGYACAQAYYYMADYFGRPGKQQK